MSDFKLTNHVTQHNNLIQAINKLDRTTFKVFEMAVSCIDTLNPKQEVALSKQDIFEFFDLKSGDKYTRMAEVMKRLSQQGIVIELEDQRKRLINVTSYLDWGTKDNQDQVIVRFNDTIMPYLIDLKKNFTKYQIAEIKGLKSKYSLVLFKWLIMEHKLRKEPVSTIKVTMDELRVLTDTVTDYIDFRNFDRWVLKVAKDEINEHTSLKVDYQKIAKRGRKITTIEWIVSSKNIRKATVVDEVTATDRLQAIIATFSVELDRGLNQAEKTMIKAWYGAYGYEALVKSLRTAAQVGTVSMRWIEAWLKDNCTSAQKDEQLSIDDLEDMRW